MTKYQFDWGTTLQDICVEKISKTVTYNMTIHGSSFST